MDARKFVVIHRKSSREENVQCKGCGAKSGPLRVGEEQDKWLEEHVCGGEPKIVEKTESASPVETTTAGETPTTPTGDPDPADDGDGDENPTREELEAMTKRDIMAAHAPEWDGTKADLVDHLLGEDEEEEEENGED